MRRPTGRRMNTGWPESWDLALNSWPDARGSSEVIDLLDTKVREFTECPREQTRTRSESR
jgi:hypothetical protein